jgi:uncharacterized protein involved in response to NO
MNDPSHVATRPTTAGVSALFAHAFRPFFLATGLYAVVLMIGWMGTWHLGWSIPGQVPMLKWHAHEMIFGLVPAAIAGFMLTAMCNWTGAAPLTGYRLAALVGLWLAGRLMMWTSGLWPTLALMVVDSAFLLVLALYVGHVILTHGNRRNLIMVAALSVMLLANLFSHAGLWWLGPVWSERAELMGLMIIVLMMAVIGGRITPAFTRNWLHRRGQAVGAIKTWPWIERLSLVLIVLLVAAVLVGLSPSWLAGLALVAGLVHGLRLVGWSGWLGWSDPLIWILHLGYAWVVIGLLLKGATLLWPVIPDSAWLHALGAGAMGTLIVGVMTRVALGHTGRTLSLPAGAVLIYLTISISALIRVAAALGWLQGSWPIWTAGLAWMLSFIIFLVLYSPILLSPRVDGRPG